MEDTSNWLKNKINIKNDITKLWGASKMCTGGNVMRCVYKYIRNW